MRTRRVHYLSLASIISAFAVVMLHTNGCFWQFSKEKYWVTANIIESVMYFAVPVFFMVSGATLIDYRERYTTKQYVAKRIQKTLIPFVIWSLIGVVYMILNNYWTCEWTLKWWKVILFRVINIEVIKIYWFFATLFSIYLCIPFLACIQKELRIKVYTYVVAVTFIFNSLIPFMVQILGINYQNQVTVPVGSGYIIYVLLGYILSKETLTTKQRYIVYVLAVIGLLMHILGTYYLSFEAGKIVQTYKGYLNVPCILYSVGIFVLFKQIGEKIKNEKLISVIEWISSYTFAVYLLHWFIMDIILRKFDTDTRTVLYRVGGAIVIFLLCIGSAWILRKISVLRKILP